MNGTRRGLPPEFWSRPDIASALASCDVPALMNAIRAAHGWTQRELAAVLGYSQTWASRVLRGEQALTIDQVREVGARIGIPLHLLRFGERGGRENPTKRREFGKAVALAGLTVLPAPPQIARPRHRPRARIGTGHRQGSPVPPRLRHPPGRRPARPRSATARDGAAVTRIACTGHRGLPGPTLRLIDAAIREHLGQHGPGLVGLSCLADGADQIFARAVLDLGGALEAVVPARYYRDGLPAAAHLGYDALLARAAAVHALPFTDSTAEAHMRASERMLGLADELLAVWDGKPARGYGGTADVVAAARQRHMTVQVIWPPGATRDG